jgi:glycosyltransferase involved in cell wall biosynthesis
MRTPTITIVTPSFNQASYLEQTIESVLSQGIDNLEYIIMDGGSTDGSVEIIRKYTRHLAYWQSQADGGQSAAIHEGFLRSTGQVLAWINSDDMYEPGVLREVQRRFSLNENLQMLYGDYSLLYADGRRVPKLKISYDFAICLYAYLMIPQPSSFWTHRLYDAVGGLNPAFHYAFDYDFFLRAGRYLRGSSGSIQHVPELWSLFRVHPESKSVSQQDGFRSEHRSICSQFGIAKNSNLRKLRQYYELARALYRFRAERGFVPLRKELGKA